MGEEVKLYVYDLSMGMARQMSVLLTGQFFDAIYHTSVVVYGREYYLSQGIQSSTPGHTPYGDPMEIISMGKTQLPAQLVLEYIESLKSVYTPEKYHLFDSNCNDFSNALCNFLVGAGIPNHILALPANFLNTPFGQTLRPMIEGRIGGNRGLQMTSSATSNVVSKPTDLIKYVYTTDQLNTIMSSNRCVAIDFTSQTCGACRTISPEFDRLIQESVNYKPVGLKGVNAAVVGVKVETGMSVEVCRHFKVMATPTFIFFLDGKKMHEFKGANLAELRSSMDLLQFTAYPPHKHATVPAPVLQSLAENPIIFTTSALLDNIFAKLKFFLIADDELIWDGIRVSMKSGCVLPPGWQNAIERALDKLPGDRVFPLLDVLRLLVLEPSVLEYFTKDPIW
ncbi:hypothetical protein SeMB42_g07865 [Synchytrium endobioticum]|uniref:Thioredoxin domain-containing protein n=1 Tax=Synchytrium endobioticum TaxID=286115 RepID=A0A507BZU0_9FUNG|nr:hypothetical protein SeMB42_g07865 [Synchytrium endobioticum]